MKPGGDAELAQPIPMGEPPRQDVEPIGRRAERVHDIEGLDQIRAQILCGLARALPDERRRDTMNAESRDRHNLRYGGQ
jgi:hypothetical protein